MVTRAYTSTDNITLTGFMGTGKTTVGRLLAQQLNRPFVDLDEQIEQHFGKSVAEIFADEGEPAFRLAEIRLCSQLAEQEGLIISTGGGALVNPASRHALTESGPVVCLTATIEEILARLHGSADRPLLPGDAAEQGKRIRDLLYTRRHAYAAIPLRVDTTGRTPDEIVDALLATLAGYEEAAGMTRIPVAAPDGEYDVCVGQGLLEQTGTLLLNRGMRPGPAAIVTNDQIAELSAAPLMAGLRTAGFEPTLCIVPEGEAHKTLETVADLYPQFLAAGLDRKSPVISLGGGVVGDMAGYAAASFLRGVPFVQIPTSLLAMVDASVGGKTGVDLPQGKNLVGAFKQPALVVIDPDVLHTLPAAEFRAGLAEVIKHGIIGAPDLFTALEEHGPTSMTHLVIDAVRVKVEVVEEDPFEQGRRATLNLGHTFGHALETVGEFSLRHGEAVALGLVSAANMAVELGRCPEELAMRIRNLVDRMGLPIQISGYDTNAVLAAMRYDKKRAGKTLRFIIPQALGDVVMIDDPGEAAVRRAVESILIG
ncbi:MAG: 3-dehydroquinate synthase [Caldilineaceae bacterium]|nr:3-dehydroquinate synthase [Caldilineaceae bacterium]